MASTGNKITETIAIEVLLQKAEQSLDKLKKLEKGIEGVEKATEKQTVAAAKGIKIQEEQAKQTDSFVKKFFDWKTAVFRWKEVFTSFRELKNLAWSYFEQIGKGAEILSKHNELLKNVQGSWMNLGEFQANAGNALTRQQQSNIINLAKMYEIPLEMMPDIAKVAVAKVREVGGSVDNELQQLTAAIGRGSQRALKMYGINVDLSKSYDEFAKKVGTTTDNLDEQTKTTIRINTVMQQMNKTISKQGENVDNATLKWQRYTAMIADFWDNFKEKTASVIFGDEALSPMDQLSKKIRNKQIDMMMSGVPDIRKGGENQFYNNFLEWLPNLYTTSGGREAALAAAKKQLIKEIAELQLQYNEMVEEEDFKKKSSNIRKHYEQIKINQEELAKFSAEQRSQASSAIGIYKALEVASGERYSKEIRFEERKIALAKEYEEKSKAFYAAIPTMEQKILKQVQERVRTRNEEIKAMKALIVTYQRAIETAYLFTKMSSGPFKLTGVVDEKTLKVWKQELAELQKMFKGMGGGGGKAQAEKGKFVAEKMANTLFDAAVKVDETVRRKWYETYVLPIIELMRPKVQEAITNSVLMGFADASIAGGSAWKNPEKKVWADREQSAPLTTLEQMQKSIKRLRESMIDDLGEVNKEIDKFADGFGATIDAISGGVPSAISASKKMAVAFIKDTTKKSAIMAIFETAAAFASLATGDVEGFILHSAAAALYTAAAGYSYATGGGGSKEKKEKMPRARQTEDKGPTTIIINMQGMVVGSSREVGSFIGQHLNGLAGTGFQLDSRITPKNSRTGW